MSRFLIFLIFPLILYAREWTTLVYMAADNDLAQWADSDLVEMETVGSDDEFSIIVQVDKPYVGAKRLLVGNGTSYELQNLGIIDMCDWETLLDFLEWGMRNYPAEKYFVVLWDHGSGWTLMPKCSYGSDWSSGNELGIFNGDLQNALKSLYAYTGEKIDLFAFDACLMQQLEVAFEIVDYAKVLLAAQALCPIQGFCYDKIFAYLNADPKQDEKDIAEAAISLIIETYSNTQPVAFSAIKLTKLDALKHAFDEFANAMMTGSPTPTLVNIRDNVQTISVRDQAPSPDDEFIDLGDLIQGLDSIFSSDETQALVLAYEHAVLESQFWGDNFSQVTGLTIWFPREYRLFKQLVDEYSGLDWAYSKWRQFLNWYYNSDDIRPTVVSWFVASNIGNNNDFELSWGASHDLAPVTYSIFEMIPDNMQTILYDPCEDSSGWNFQGFTIDSSNTYSGSACFFSGNSSYLQNSIEINESILLQDMGIIDLYLYYNTEDMTDSLIIEFAGLRDIHYGWSNGWQRRRVILPAGSDKLRISYRTNGSINRGGCYIDEIEVKEIKSSKFIREYLSDTALYIFGKIRGDYGYAVFAEDDYGNTGNLSDFIDVSLDRYAAPYSVPGPFQTNCDIVLDFPDSLLPTVKIFSLSGRLVRSFDPEQIDKKRIYWDGKDRDDKDVGSGLYFVLVKDEGFKKLGKIARQR
ncbi:MAG: clostripain-related cysteine peptidase [bacterium]